jgi:hypothetical protein
MNMQNVHADLFNEHGLWQMLDSLSASQAQAELGFSS